MSIYTLLLFAVAVFAFAQACLLLYLTLRNGQKRDLASTLFTCAFYFPQVILPIIVLWGVFFG